jgi:plasmid stabilization system protein ParE
MPLPVVYGRSVGPSLANAYGWYEAQRAGLGEEFLAAVDVSFDAIEMYPQMFALVHGVIRRAIVSRFPYAVFYRVELGQILVLNVLHTASDPRSWPRPRNQAR